MKNILALVLFLAIILGIHAAVAYVWPALILIPLLWIAYFLISIRLDRKEFGA